MNAIKTIVLNDLKIYLSSFGNLVGLIVLPIAFTLVLGWAFSSGDGGAGGEAVQVRVDVLDQDRSDASMQLLAELRSANDTLVLCPMDNDADDFCRLAEGDDAVSDTALLTLALGQERASDELTDGFLVIPSGYGQALVDFASSGDSSSGDGSSGASSSGVELHFYAEGNPGLPNPVQQTVEAVLQKVNGASLTAGVADALLDGLGEQTGLGALIGPIQPAVVDAIYVAATEGIAQRGDVVRYQTTGNAEEDDTGEAAPSGADDGFGQSVPGMGTMYVMFTVLAATSVLLRERNQWTLQRLTALPIARSQVLGGKIITYFILGMIQFLIIFAVGLMVGLDYGERPLLVFPIMIAFVLCITALAFAIAPWMQNQEQAGGVARLLALAFAPLGGAWWPLEIVPDFMRAIGHLSPVAWAMDAFHDIMWFGGGLAEIAPELGVLLGAAALLFGVGVRSFKYTN